MSLDFKPVRANLGQQVFEYLLENIYKMDLLPGSRLGVGEIADQLGISRSPVRDALHLLVAEGLVEYGKNNGYHVVGINRKYIEDVFVARRTLEPAALRLAAVDLDETRVRQLCETWQQLRTPPSSDAEILELHMNADSQLHQAMGEMCGNAVLQDMVTKVVNKSAWIRRWVYANGVPDSHLMTMADEHLQILEALLANRPEEAAGLLDRHLTLGQAVALDYL
ncbi:MAG: hypothetical protein CL610_25285 [Anaerolineaceae bacterium]|nr:hypothetical protein [Anaerolineaceae bacterium]